MCPKCNEKYSLSTNKNIIYCNKCDLKVTIDNRYNFHGVQFKNISQWYDWQVDQIRNEIKNNDEYCLESEVELRHLSRGGKKLTRFSGNGICKLDKTGLRYVGTQDGENVDKFFKKYHKLFLL